MNAVTRLRLSVFVALSALGIVYISATYLGIVDRALGRGYSVTAQLDGTGGLYIGSEVTYRGVSIGKVAAMSPRGRGVDVRLDLDDDVKLPRDTAMFVHNGSAVGEQYLDFEPVSSEGPFVEPGEVLTGQADTLPVDEADLLVDMDRFVRSVNTKDLSTVIAELGTAFFNAGEPLQDLIDGSNKLIDAAVANKDETISLLRRGEVVLRTQEANADNIKEFAAGLNTFTRALADSDRNVRVLLEGGPSTLEQVRKLMEGLQPTMPVLLSNLVTVNQVVATRLPALEQLLVTLPAAIAGGFDGASGGFGKVHLNFNQNPPPCTAGYLPKSQWRPPSDISDNKGFLQARCAGGPQFSPRGTNNAPRPSGAAARVAPYDVTTGTFEDGGQTYVMDSPGVRDIYGEDAWKWMLVGPTLEP